MEFQKEDTRPERSFGGERTKWRTKGCRCSEQVSRGCSVVRDSEAWRVPEGSSFNPKMRTKYAFTDTPALSQADEGSVGALPSRRRQQLAKELRRGKRWDERPEYLARLATGDWRLETTGECWTNLGRGACQGCVPASCLYCTALFRASNALLGFAWLGRSSKCSSNRDRVVGWLSNGSRNTPPKRFA